MQDKVHEEVDILKDSLLKNQIEVAGEIERIANEKLQNSMDYQNEDIKLGNYKSQSIHLQFEVDK